MPEKAESDVSSGFWRHTTPALAFGGALLAFTFGAVIQGATQPGAAADNADYDLRHAPPHDPGFLRVAALQGEAGRAPKAGPDMLEPVVFSLEVKPGDTLMGILTDAGIVRSEAYAAIEAMSEVYDPRHLRPGQNIEVKLEARHPLDESDEGEEKLLGLELRPNLETDIKVERVASAQTGEESILFNAMEVERPLSMLRHYAAGAIDSSLYEAAVSEGVPVRVLVDLIRAYSFDVDFQREVRQGDSFELVFETFEDEEGKLAKTGDILTATLVLSGKPLTYYYYTPASGLTDFFNAQGQSIRKTLLATPVDGARISSGFGVRRHPISGYNKMHKGVDFAAPSGTPIYAAGDGVVERAGRNGGYGNYVRIRHNSTYSTAYAHMKGFARGIKSGARVRQGDVIGYVGSTGRSTGPHLHYEVMENGTQVNPRSIKLPSGEVLAGEDLKGFQRHVAELEALREELHRSTLIAERPSAE